jgi:hypothetical protein
MFGSKSKQTQPSTPEMPWAIQILTTEYLIDGTVQPAEYKSWGHNALMEALESAANLFAYLLSFQ